MKDSKKIQARIDKINKELSDISFYGGPDPDPVRTASLIAERDALIWVLSL